MPQDSTDREWKASRESSRLPPLTRKDNIWGNIVIGYLIGGTILGLAGTYLQDKSNRERNDRLTSAAFKLAAQDGFKISGKPKPDFQGSQSGTYDFQLVLAGCSAHAIAHTQAPLIGDVPSDITDYSIQLPNLPGSAQDRYVNVTSLTALASPTEGLGPNYCRVINGVDPAPAGVRSEP